jgi:diguanylate cyclase (GGDEF)-like protein
MYQNPVVIVKHPGAPGDFYDENLKHLTDKRICEGAVDALQVLEETPAHILIIESDLVDMSATELAEVIRDIDSEKSHFTYIIVLADELDEQLAAAAEQDVDQIVPKNDAQRLVFAVTAAGRISDCINDLEVNKAALVREREVLRKGQLLDPLTGLGNRRLAEQSLNDMIRQIEARGGAVCLLIIKVGNYEALMEEHDEHIAQELIKAIAERIDGLIRPMDIATYFRDGEFALILLQPSMENCTAECYQRIFDGIQLKSYRTAVGYLEATIGMSLCASHAENGPPLPEKMISVAESHLEEAVSKQTIVVEHLVD